MEEGGEFLQKFTPGSKQRKRKRKWAFYHENSLDELNINNENYAVVEDDLLTFMNESVAALVGCLRKSPPPPPPPPLSQLSK